jgi:hypothetical protein
MKTPAVIVAVGCVMFALGLNLHSQNVAPKSPVDQLKTLQLKNAELIQKQQATLLKLDEMAKQAEQMRFLTKRG